MKINRESSCHILRLSSFEGFLKWGYTQIIHFSRSFPSKPAIFGYPHLSYHQIIRSSDFIIVQSSSGRLFAELCQNSMAVEEVIVSQHREYLQRTLQTWTFKVAIVHVLGVNTH